MSLFDDAAIFMKNRQSGKDEKLPDQSDNREDLIKRLRSVYENATVREIERAIDKVTEKEGKLPADYQDILQKIRIYLED